MLLRRTLYGVLWLLLGDSLYLCFFARTQMGSAVGALVLLHIALGFLLTVPFFILYWKQRREARHLWRGHWSLVTGHWSLTMFAALTCALTGAWLTAHAAAGHSTAHLRWRLTLHIVSGFVAAVLLIVPPLVRAVQRLPARLRSRLGFVLCLLPFAFCLAAFAAYEYAPRSYYRTLTATNAAQAGNPYFPAELSVIRSQRTPVRSSAYCGTTGCHTDIYQKWRSSTHRATASSIAFRKSSAYFTSRKGSAAARWCKGCHNPNGLWVMGYGLWGKDQNPKPKTHNLDAEGVNCLACHAITRVKELTGNGRYELTLPSEYPFADAHKGLGYWLHGFLIRVRPAPHQQAFLKRGLHDTSEFCSGCHRVSFNVPQNYYKFLRGQDEYGEWQNSYLSGNSVHGFYPPAKQKRCQDCHDPHAELVVAELVVRHGAQRSAVVDGTPLRSVSDYQLYPVTVDIFALRRAAANSREEELIAPLDNAVVRPGESVVVDVVVHNGGVGHDFPTGFNDIKEVWLEFKVADAKGRVFFHSGKRDANGFVDEDAHAYRLVALDRAGQRIDKNNLFDMVTPLYHRTIPASQSDVVRYRFTVPKDTSGALTLTARLNYRKLNAWFARWAYAGRRTAGQKPPPVGALTDTTRWTFDPSKPVPQLPVRVVAEDRAVLQVMGYGLWVMGQRTAQNPKPKTHNPKPLSFYNYAVALLTQGDLPRAARAFRQVQTPSPKGVLVRIGLGRVYLAEGDLLAARAQFLDALRLAPRSPQARAFLGTTLRKMGQYDEALKELKPVAEQFPRDRLLHFDIGMCYFLSGRYEEASRAFQRMLDIDPDDLSAHYNLMLCYQRLRRVSDARREEAVYRYLKEDETVKQITGPYLLAHPIDDREVQTIHEHALR